MICERRATNYMSLVTAWERHRQSPAPLNWEDECLKTDMPREPEITGWSTGGKGKLHRPTDNTQALSSRVQMRTGVWGQHRGPEPPESCRGTKPAFTEAEKRSLKVYKCCTKYSQMNLKNQEGSKYFQVANSIPEKKWLRRFIET